MRVGFGISPGLSIEYHTDDDRRDARRQGRSSRRRRRRARRARASTTSRSAASGRATPRPARPPGCASTSATAPDSCSSRPSTWVTASTPYLEALGEGVPDDVPIGWTGDAVVNDTITAAQASGRAAALGGRPPLVWDNYPVNDGFMTDRLHLGPLWGREAELVDRVLRLPRQPDGAATASKLPLASIAAWLRGEDPLDGWAAEAERRRGGCSPRPATAPCPKRWCSTRSSGSMTTTAGRRAVEPLRDWLKAAADCEAPGLEDEVAPWLEQVHAEARLGLDAIKLVKYAARRQVRKGPRSSRSPSGWCGQGRGEPTSRSWGPASGCNRCSASGPTARGRSASTRSSKVATPSTRCCAPRLDDLTRDAAAL